jgi:hypothetical protein
MGHVGQLNENSFDLLLTEDGWVVLAVTFIS